MWSWSRPGHDVFLAKFDLRSSAGALVAFVFSDQHFADHLLIVDVNLTTGHSRELLTFRTGPLSLTGLRLCGDYFACHVFNEDFVLLINWRAEEFILFGAFYTPTQSWLTICPGGYLMLAYNAANAPPHVRLYSFASFDGLWRPISELDLDVNDRFNATRIRPAISLQLPSNDMSGESMRANSSLTLLESPIHAETCELISEVVDVVTVPLVGASFWQPFTRLLSFFRRPYSPRPSTSCTIRRSTWSRHLLALPTSPSTPPYFTLKSLFRHSPGFFSTSAAGYGVRYDGVERLLVQRLDSVESTELLVFPFPGGDERRFPWVCLTHSGAAIALYESKVVVYHYL
ncbi:hypothetical protein B0H14DRAFT_830300 [Mycena olivaceomarginata]|nr:hypothetical protein B0H14DRAFT_830300 [Mycena olivaceomarginata]